MVKKEYIQADDTKQANNGQGRWLDGARVIRPLHVLHVKLFQKGVLLLPQYFVMLSFLPINSVPKRQDRICVMKMDKKQYSQHWFLKPWIKRPRWV